MIRRHAMLPELKCTSVFDVHEKLPHAVRARVRPAAAEAWINAHLGDDEVAYIAVRFTYDRSRPGRVSGIDCIEVFFGSATRALAFATSVDGTFIARPFDQDEVSVTDVKEGRTP